MSKYVTKTGRAISPGTVTRRSALYSTKRDQKPLPIHLQVHPKALTRTSRNPGCLTYRPASGWAAHFIRRAREEASTVGFATGQWLPASGEWTLYVQDKAGHEFGTFHCDDINMAFGWKQAAEQFGFRVSMYHERCE